MYCFRWRCLCDGFSSIISVFVDALESDELLYLSLILLEYMELGREDERLLGLKI
jgi:hypothetical protein